MAPCARYFLSQFTIHDSWLTDRRIYAKLAHVRWAQHAAYRAIVHALEIEPSSAVVCRPETGLWLDSQSPQSTLKIKKTKLHYFPFGAGSRAREQKRTSGYSSSCGLQPAIGMTRPANDFPLAINRESAAIAKRKIIYEKTLSASDGCAWPP